MRCIMYRIFKRKFPIINNLKLNLHYEHFFDAGLIKIVLDLKIYFVDVHIGIYC